MTLGIKMMLHNDVTIVLLYSNVTIEHTATFNKQLIYWKQHNNYGREREPA